MKHLVRVVFISVLLKSITSQLNLLVFGDTGQFQEFYQNPGSAVDNDGSLFKLVQDNGSTKGTCTKIGSAWQGFVNFYSVINNDLQSGQKYLCNADQIVILGDLTYVEVGSYKLITTSNSRYQPFVNRLICMWYNFRDLIATIPKNCPANSKNPLNTLSSDGRYENLALVTGNHSYDVDIDIETQQMANLVTNRGTYFDGTVNFLNQANERPASWFDLEKFVSISVRISNGVRVEFLDVNFYPIYCYLITGKNQSNYNSCFYVKNAYGIFPDFSYAQTYTNSFIQALKSFSNSANWRVIRSHNGIFLVDGGTFEQLELFYVQADDSGNTILDLIKAAKVNLLLAAHDHFGQVSVFPWDQLSDLKAKYNSNSTTIGSTTLYNVDSTVCTPDSTGACKYSCYYNDKFLGGYNENYDCYKNQTMSMKLNPSNPSNLITLLVGFSGRKLDYIQSDQRTSATVLFERAVQNSYGGVYLQFFDNSLTANFFFGNTTFTFSTLPAASGTDTYNVISEFTKEKILNQLIGVTNTFNYSLYNITSSAGFINKSYLLNGILILLFSILY